MQKYRKKRRKIERKQWRGLGTKHPKSSVHLSSVGEMVFYSRRVSESLHKGCETDCCHVWQMAGFSLDDTYTRTSVLSGNGVLPVSLSGSNSVRWRDPVRPAATGLPPLLPPSGETQDRPHPLHDWMVYVRLLQNSTLGVCAACLGHVPLWR